MLYQQNDTSFYLETLAQKLKRRTVKYPEAEVGDTGLALPRLGTAPPPPQLDGLDVQGKSTFSLRKALIRSSLVQGKPQCPTFSDPVTRRKGSRSLMV